MTTSRFDFASPAGYTLSGRLDAPAGAARGWALFAHCFTCGKDNAAAVRIARVLAAAGIGTLRFDFAGLGTSGGGFGRNGFGADVADLVAAAGAMEAAGTPPSLLIGHSLGGAAALAAAGALPGIKAVATINAPFEVDHLLLQFAPQSLAAIEAEGEAEVRLAGRPFVISRSFVEDLRRHELGERIAGLRRALLVLHAPRDDTVGIDNAGRIFAAARHSKSFVSLDGAGHLLSSPADAEYAASLIAAWSLRYLPV